MKKFLSILMSGALVVLVALSVGENPTARATTSEASTVLQIAAGENHTLALLDDKSVWAWGSNEYGQVGDGTNFTRNLPTMVISEDGVLVDGERLQVVAIAAGANHSFAVLTDGRVVAWGNNRYGQLGDSTTGNRDKPVPVMISASEYFYVTTWEADDEPNISAGFGHTMAISQDGYLYGWGNNTFGQLGNLQNTNKLNPTKVKFIPDEIQRDSETEKPLKGADGRVLVEEQEQPACELVAAGYNHTIAYTSSEKFDYKLDDDLTLTEHDDDLDVADVTLWGFGNNTAGQLGTDDTTNRNRPTPLAEQNLTPDKLRAGNAHTLMISGSTLYGWGSNMFGQIKLESDAVKFTTPQEMMTDADDVRGGYNHEVILHNDGTVSTQGYNNRGQLGNGLVELNSSSEQVKQEDPDFEPITDREDPAFGMPPDTIPIYAHYIDAGYYFSIMIDAEGALWVWGDNGYGQLGDGTFLKRPSARPLPTRVFYETVKPVVSLDLSAKQLTIGLGEDFSKLLTVTIKPENALYTDITWTSSNTDIVAIIAEPLDSSEEDYEESTYPRDRVRLIGNKKAGYALVTATAYNNVSVTCKVFVKPSPLDVVITAKPSKMVRIGDFFHMQAKVLPVDTYDTTVEWSVLDFTEGDDEKHPAGDPDNEEIETYVASIDPVTGLLTALDTGKVVVQARSIMDHTKYDTWLVTCGVYAQKTEIYAEQYDPGGDMERVKEITLYIDLREKPVAYGSKDLYGVNFPDESTTDCVWSSLVPDVADAESFEDGRGRITARKPGTTTITCQSTDKASKATVKVTVKPLGENIILTDDTVKTGDIVTGYSSGTIRVFEGTTTQIHSRVTPGKATQTIEWANADEEHPAATISVKGKILALQPGTVTVTATTVDWDLIEFAEDPGYTKAATTYELTIEVVRPATKLVLTPNKAEMISSADGGEDFTLTLMITPYDALMEYDDFLWTTNNRNAAFFDEDSFTVIDQGVAQINVKSSRSGVAKLTVTAKDGGKRAVATITVRSRPAGITLNVKGTEEEPVRLVKGKTLTLKANVVPSDASQKVYWRLEPVDGALAATINESGVMRVIGTGVVKVWAESQVTDSSGDPTAISEELFVNCVVPIKTFTIKPSKITATQGQTVTFAYTVSPIEASDLGVRVNIAEVERLGLIFEDDPDRDSADENYKYINAANGFITFEVDSGAPPGGPYKVNLYGDGKTAELKLTIREVPEGVEIITMPKEDEESGAILIWKGKTYKLQARVDSALADQAVVWYTSNPDVATIDAKGTLKGTGAGEVEIWCTPAGDPTMESERYTIYCQVPVTSVALKPNKLPDIMVGSDPIEIAVIIKPNDAYNYLGWEVVGRTDGEVAGIERPSDTSDYFTITPLAAGTDTITVSLQGKTASLKVTVRDIPEAVDITTPERDTPLLKGRQLNLRAVVDPPTASQKVTWESSDPSVAKVSSTGAVTVVGQGSVTIRAYTFDNEYNEVSSADYVLETQVPISGIKITPSTIQVTEGESAQAMAAVRPIPEAYAGSNPAWKVRSSSSAIAEAEIDEEGNITVTGVSKGTCTITVTMGGKSATLSVRVNAAK
ncbi:hypothetical protein FACS1894202_05540 [Clostridia bacterium]|nr:hypothetical protein FACS1894202_05540 [Clostridia bacterium]